MSDNTNAIFLLDRDDTYEKLIGYASGIKIIPEEIKYGELIDSNVLQYHSFKNYIITSFIDDVKFYNDNIINPSVYPITYTTTYDKDNALIFISTDKYDDLISINMGYNKCVFYDFSHLSNDIYVNFFVNSGWLSIRTEMIFGTLLNDYFNYEDDIGLALDLDMPFKYIDLSQTNIINDYGNRISFIFRLDGSHYYDTYIFICCKKEMKELIINETNLMSIIESKKSPDLDFEIIWEIID